MAKNKYINQAIYSLGHKYPDFIYLLRQIEFVERKEEEKEPLSTDGIRIFYSNSYLENVSMETVEKQLMHILLHGMAGHFSRRKHYSDKELIDSVMDTQVTILMSVLGFLDAYEEAELKYKLQIMGKKRYDLGLYNRLLQDEYKKEDFICDTENFESDNHNDWEKAAEEETDFWTEYRNGMEGESHSAEEEQESDENAFGIGKEAADICEKLGEKFTKQAGKGKGNQKTYYHAEETAMSYEEVWKNLARITETVKEEVDSIDPMLYHYGLELYENIPLVEPREVNDTYDIKTMVIAIDTSGSCASESIMQQFWGSTRKIVRELSEYGVQAEIIILECDDEIQKEERWSIQEFLSDTLEQREIFGNGGTNFIPVFEQIETYQEEGTEISGLIYFTDGYGCYPDKKPNYPVYFVLTEEDYGGRMPEWIQKISMENV